MGEDARVRKGDESTPRDVRGRIELCGTAWRAVGKRIAGCASSASAWGVADAKEYAPGGQAADARRALRPLRPSHRANRAREKARGKGASEKNAAPPAMTAIPVCASMPPNPAAGRPLMSAWALPLARVGSRYVVEQRSDPAQRAERGEVPGLAARTILPPMSAAAGMRERVSVRSATATATQAPRCRA